jgi:Protein of unknown function (DUF1566)
MKRILSYSAVIIGLGLTAFTALAQTTANGPYYATPSWDQTLPAATRFIVLSNFAGAAVLDRETGLVWEQSPDTTNRAWGGPGVLLGDGAQFHCNNKTVGNRKGWRLPTLQELTSLVDPSNPGGNPDLPPGHPFINVQSDNYWSATTYAANTSFAQFVSFFSSGVGISAKTNQLFVWCVRGGQGVDPQ